MELNKENLEQYQKDSNELISLKDKLKLKRINFDEENKSLIDDISRTSETLSIQKEALKEQGLEEYERTKEKKLMGGLGIRVSDNLIYETQKALAWAEKSGIALQLDTKTFESFAKSQLKDLVKAKLEFVATEEVTKVIFPKEIKFE